MITITRKLLVNFRNFSSLHSLLVSANIFLGLGITYYPPQASAQVVIPAKTQINQHLFAQANLANKGILTIFANRSGSALQSLQVAPANSRDWQGNLLKQAVPNQDEARVTVASDRTACRYAIRAEFANGRTLEDADVDLCKNDIYTLVAVPVARLW